MLNYNNFLKLPVIKDTKRPAVSGWNNNECDIKEVDINKFDVGIITGERNNLLVLDVDIKDDGLQEINKFIQQYGDINTFTIKTPSGGMHYYFKLKSSNDATNYLIEHHITNRTKYRGCGLDIRTNGGYVKAPPSKGYNILNNIEINEIDKNLIIWLLQEQRITDNINISTKDKEHKEYINKSNYIYNLDENK